MRAKSRLSDGDDDNDDDDDHSSCDLEHCDGKTKKRDGERGDLKLREAKSFLSLHISLCS